jgi:hypothetical protein
MKRFVGALALFLALPAGAQTGGGGAKPQTDLGPTSSSSDRPWANKVTPEEQKMATDLFREGNALLKESLFVQAAAKYREALKHWNHPGIHYNLALALLNLDQPVEVYLQLEEAMKYGHAPLDTDKFDHAGRYKALIEKQLARVEIVCEAPGARVSLDGHVLFTAPGKSESLVRVGQHTIVAEKTGYVTAQKTPMLPPGVKTTVDLKLYTAEELTHYKRRWHQAMPWSILAAGVVVAAVGGILHWQAGEKMKEYDSGVSACSMGSMNGGCMPDGDLAGKRSAAEALQGVAIAGYAIGGAIVVTGGVLAYLNRAQPYRVIPDRETPVSVLPLIGPTGGGAVATFHF